MSYELTGKIKQIDDLMKFDSGFEKRVFVVTTEDERYPQDISFEALQGKVSIVDSITVGDNVTVTFDVRGREHDSKHYNTLVAWKLSVDGTSESFQQVVDDPVNADDFEDDIPF